jgi:hypothetical protein
MAIRFTATHQKGAWGAAMTGHTLRAATAATTAMRQTVNEAKLAARAEVRKAGGLIAIKLPNVMRGEAYPRPGKVSLHPAGLVWARSDWLGILDENTVIRGKPMLWLPLPGVPRRYLGQRVRPGLFRGLMTISRPGKPPLLAIRLKATEARFGKALTPSFLKRGAAAKRGVERWVPLFVGLPAVTMPKRTDIRRAIEHAAAGLGRNYFAALNS